MAKPAKVIALRPLVDRDEPDREKRRIARGQEFKTELRTEREIQMLLDMGVVALADSDEAKIAVEDYEVSQRIAAVRAERDAGKKEK